MPKISNILSVVVPTARRSRCKTYGLNSPVCPGTRTRPCKNIKKMVGWLDLFNQPTVFFMFLHGRVWARFKQLPAYNNTCHVKLGCCDMHSRVHESDAIHMHESRRVWVRFKHLPAYNDTCHVHDIGYKTNLISSSKSI